MSANFDLDDVQASIADDIAYDVREAVQYERIEIIRMIEAEASRHDDAAAELRHDYDHADIADEAWHHDCDAATLRAIADRIRARTPAPEPVEVAEDEIAF